MSEEDKKHPGDLSDQLPDDGPKEGVISPMPHESEVQDSKLDKFIIIARDPRVEPDGIGFQVNGMDMDEAIVLLMHGSAKFERQYEKWLRDRY